MIVQTIKRRAGVFGAFFFSGANFFLAFLLQSEVHRSGFGSYAFSIVLIQFGTSVSNALFASPIVVWFQDETVNRAELLRSYLLANFVFVGIGSLVVAVVLLGVGMSGPLVALVVAQAFLFWMRWFFRAVELANHNFVRSAMADVVYGVATVLAGAALFLFVKIDVSYALVAMIVGSLASIAVIGRDTLRQVLARGTTSFALFNRSFRAHGAWALLGVVTTEITANLHSYVLTIGLGPAAFAPVATLSLFFRPIPILMQALTQFERPLFAKFFREGALGRLSEEVQKFTAIMTGAVVLNTLAVAALLAFAGSLIGGGQYRTEDLWLLLLPLAAGQLVRALRAAPSAAAQGAGRFRPLAFATVFAAPLTVCGTVAAIAVGWQIVPMVLLAVLAGEVVTAVLIRRVYRGLRSAQES